MEMRPFVHTLLIALTLLDIDMSTLAVMVSSN